MESKAQNLEAARCQDGVIVDGRAALLDSLPGRLVLADEREQCHA